MARGFSQKDNIGSFTTAKKNAIIYLKNMAAACVGGYIACLATCVCVCVCTNPLGGWVGVRIIWSVVNFWRRTVLCQTKCHYLCIGQIFGTYSTIPSITLLSTPILL